MTDEQSRQVMEIVKKCVKEIIDLSADLPKLNDPSFLDQWARQIAGRASMLTIDVSNVLTPKDDSWKDLAPNPNLKVGPDENDHRFDQGEKRKEWNFISTAGKKKAVTIFTHGNAAITEEEAMTAFKSWETAGGTNTAAHTARGMSVEVIWEESN